MRYRVFLDPAPVDLNDPEPEGYLEWHEWARLQARAKRRQRWCKNCGRLWWPHTKRCRTCEREAALKAGKAGKAEWLT